jgi:pimeloyl-ACP methyl ester carboxylesterase
MHVETVGAGPRVVLLHGSVTSGTVTWVEQKPLADRFTLVVVNRSGYPPGPPLASTDFETQAQELLEILRPGDHLVAHSYGGVVALLASAKAPLASLTVIEPPAFGIARGHPAVEAFLDSVSEAPRDPRGYLEHFLPLVGSRIQLPDPLPAAIEAGARAAIAERPPHEAEIPLADLAAAPYPKLVVSGAHSEAFDAVCDVLEERLGAERAVVGGVGHSIPRAGARFNDVLLAFLSRAHRAAAGAP